jgi:putative transposase
MRPKAAFDSLVDKYRARYDNTAASLTRDCQALWVSYDFHAENWNHVRASDTIESTLATIRLRTDKTKGIYPARPRWR